MAAIEITTCIAFIIVVVTAAYLKIKEAKHG